MKRGLTIIPGLLMMVLAASAQSPLSPQSSYGSGSIVYSQGADPSSFLIATAAQATPILVDTADYWLVNKAASWLAGDISKVCGSSPALLRHPSSRTLIIIGTLEKSSWIRQLAPHLDLRAVEGKWECFSYQIIEHPFKGVDRALVILGSDKRGAAYGALELSRQIGVSPWNWWADVPVQKKDSIYLNTAYYVSGSPGVKYRGIFINDEAPAFSGWARATFGGINHQAYEKIFELLLRLKANYLWPAMWGNAFNDDDKLDPALADQYGIVMGTSHHEPMLRAQQEWKRYGSGPWNYQTNQRTLDTFWKKGIQNMGDHESIVTVGMRGDGDLPMSTQSNVDLLEKIVSDQRQIISDVTGKPADQTPQSWALYKEVQDYYDKGMRVPDDVTLLLCDDNWGNIRRLPALDAPARKGGYGIYYHFDYVGDPRNYKWLNTNSIGRVYEQMHLAYEHQVRQIWIVNVGDLKPMELPISFFLDYAWNPQAWNPARVEAYTRTWAAEQFGPTHAAAIGFMLSRYTIYNSRRKPELLSPDTYSLTHYREAERVTAAYDLLARQADSLYEELPPDQKDAFYELVRYPIDACANLQDLYTAAATNHWYYTQGRISANAMADSVRAYFVKDSLLTRRYNLETASGKWNHMMDQTHIGYTNWQEPAHNKMPPLYMLPLSDMAALGLYVEGAGQVGADTLPEFNFYCPDRHYIDLFTKGLSSVSYEITSPDPWVALSATQGAIQGQTRVWVTIKTHLAPAGTAMAHIHVKGSDGQTFDVVLPWFGKLTSGSVPLKGFVETDGYLSMHADHYTSADPSADMHASAGNDSLLIHMPHWVRLRGIGNTGTGMTIFPVSATAAEPGAGPHLDYACYLFDTGQARIQVYCAPTLDYAHTGGRRFALSVDNEAPEICTLSDQQSEPAWGKMVADNSCILTLKHHFGYSGTHVLHVWMVDPGVVLEQIVLDLGGAKPTYLGPPETPVFKGLKDVFRDQFPMGVSVAPYNLRTDKDLIMEQFNSLTPENAMKMEPIHPRESQYNFGRADSIVNYAFALGLKVRGHNLCWHEQVPDWMFKDEGGNDVTKEVLLQRLQEHIHTVVSRYKGKIYAWDVVNEAISNNPQEYLRNSPWYRICGEDFIKAAFIYAHATDPNAVLFYNDYDTERPEKRERVYRLLKSLLDQGVPVQGVGLQGHWSIDDPSGKNLRDAIERFSSLGLQVQITELDMSVYPIHSKGSFPPGVLTPELEALQAQRYTDLFHIFVQYASVISGVTFWNVTDRHTWLDQFPVRGRKNFPLLFDMEGEPKAAYWEILESNP
jgi:GH35 family endo-1,4-beta-xylanase